MAWTLVLLAASAGALSAKPPSILAIGETLYDSLPHGVFLGGAPLNVAVHAVQLGAHAAYASAVGDDALGRDAKRRLEALNVDCELVQGKLIGHTEADEAPPDAMKPIVTSAPR